jgi:hypothetical protein
MVEPVIIAIGVFTLAMGLVFLLIMIVRDIREHRALRETEW